MQIKVKKITQLTGHNGSIYSVKEGEAKHFMLSAAGDGWVVQWDLANPEVGRLIAKADKNIYAMCYVLRPSQYLILGDMDGGLHWVALTNPDEQRNIAFHKNGVFDIQNIDNQIITIGGDGVLARWNIEKQRVTESVQLAQQSLRCMAFSADRNELAVGSSDRNIYVLSADTLTLKHTIENAHNNSIFALQYSPDGKHLLSGGRDALLRVWDSEQNFQLISSQPAHLYTINKIVFHPERKIFATASRDKTIKIWDATTYELLKVIDTLRSGCHTHSVNTLYWSPYNNWLISGSDDRSAMIWDISFEA
jgi:WD40 repeat protein